MEHPQKWAKQIAPKNVCSKVYSLFDVKVRTMASGYGLCGFFLAGNEHVLVGTKEGCLELYDLRVAEQSTKMEVNQRDLPIVTLLHISPKRTLCLLTAEPRRPPQTPNTLKQ
eukprot:4204527-Amphidinium_carterae.1